MLQLIWERSREERMALFELLLRREGFLRRHLLDA
ncbi:hypothetical protein SAMN05446635_5912 [Burkholderia sp. OK233]|nr:hypothetical protein SAMN05446635_5912 [Burkholderia sp. OK233]